MRGCVSGLWKKITHEVFFWFFWRVCMTKGSRWSRTEILTNCCGAECNGRVLWGTWFMSCLPLLQCRSLCVRGRPYYYLPAEGDPWPLEWVREKTWQNVNHKCTVHPLASSIKKKKGKGKTFLKQNQCGKQAFLKSRVPAHETVGVKRAPQETILAMNN